MHTGQLYIQTKKTLPPNKILVPSEESDDDLVESLDREIDISIESDSARVGSVEERYEVRKVYRKQIGVLTNDNNTLD